MPASGDRRLTPNLATVPGSLDRSCRTTIGGYARRLPEGRVNLTGLVARADGSFLLKRSLECLRADVGRAVAELGDSLRADWPRDVFALYNGGHAGPIIDIDAERTLPSDGGGA